MPTLRWNYIERVVLKLLKFNNLSFKLAPSDYNTQMKGKRALDFGGQPDACTEDKLVNFAIRNIELTETCSRILPFGLKRLSPGLDNSNCAEWKTPCSYSIHSQSINCLSSGLGDNFSLLLHSYYKSQIKNNGRELYFYLCYEYGQEAVIKLSLFYDKRLSSSKYANGSPGGCNSKVFGFSL